MDNQPKLYEGNLGWHNNVINHVLVLNRIKLQEVAEVAYWDNAPYESNDEDELWER